MIYILLKLWCDGHPGHKDLTLQYERGNLTLWVRYLNLTSRMEQHTLRMETSWSEVTTRVEELVRQFPHERLRGSVRITWSDAPRGGGTLEVASIEELVEFLELGIALVKDESFINRKDRMVK